MVNPYVSPSPQSAATRPPLRAFFEVGREERHTVAIYMAFAGREVYAVDDVEVLQLERHPIRKIRRFEVGLVERHLVEVKFAIPRFWKRMWSGHDFLAAVFVDGAVVVPDLLPDWRRRAKGFQRFLNITLIAGLFLMLVLMIVLAVM